MPLVNGVIHHGMTKISGTSNEPVAETFNATMRIPDKLFIDLKQLDFIKCDVEGYEHFVFENMVNTIQKFKPIIQCELGGTADNRKKVIQLLESIGYKTYILNNYTLVAASATQKENWSNDFYFKPN
ncbi:MAG: FkbM family methyltransferase [Bacteroidia bacterium]|nr:FkbM family methyltransferase [Bacteroidia bacterium]